MNPSGKHDVVLEAAGVSRTYRTRGASLTAVDSVDLKLHAGETLGIVGESGCGKSTLAKMLVGLEPPDRGEVYIDGDRMQTGIRRFVKSSRKVQMVFQDPYTSLDPRMTAGQIVREPFEIHRSVVPRGQREAKVAELFERVGLSPDHLDRYPSEFSGGQRQRIGIARALALDPKVLVLDEPVSALDVSVQAQVINLLAELKRDLGISYVFIAHDLSIMRQISDRIAVMYLGKVVETGPVERVFDYPLHPYTRGLIDAVPVPDPAVPMRREVAIAGDVPSPMARPSGCHFHTRCPVAEDRCSRIEPTLLPHITDDHTVACQVVTGTGAEAVDGARPQ